MPSRKLKGRMIAAMSKKKPERTTLPDGLRQALTNSGKTSYQLMAETGVNHGVILRFMKGERDIRLETAEKLAAAVGLTVRVPPSEKGELN
jgi:transcriptional regulator with XRE-family HTH domain